MSRSVARWSIEIPGETVVWFCAAVCTHNTSRAFSGPTARSSCCAAWSCPSCEAAVRRVQQPRGGCPQWLDASARCRFRSGSMFRGRRRRPALQTDSFQPRRDPGRCTGRCDQSRTGTHGAPLSEPRNRRFRWLHRGRHRRLIPQILVLPMRRRCTGSRKTAFPQGHSDRDPIGRPRAGIRQDEVGFRVLLSKEALV